MSSQLERYKALFATARCFGRSMDLATLIDHILDRTRDVMRAEGCGLLLPDPVTGELMLHSTDPRVRRLAEPLRIPAGAGLAAVVYQTRQMLNIKDAQTDPRHYQALGLRLGFVTHAIISIPLLDGVRCLGVLQAMNSCGRPAFNEEDEEIMEGFGGFIVNALLHLEAQKLQIERAQNQRDLLLAREIQDSFLPEGVQKFPFAQVHLSYSPAQLVGGDFYFVKPVGSERLLAGLGDVSGKGIPAALTMARVTAMINGLVSQLESDLGEWVTKLNRLLVPDLKAGRFVAMTFFLADAASATLQICAAGQYPPFRGDQEKWNHLPVPSQLPLGIISEMNYAATSVSLRPGEFWLLFSDGIAEARNPAGEEWGVDGFLAALPHGVASARTLAAATDGWRKHLGAALPHDDASMLLLDWRGLPPPAEFRTTCAPENLCQGRAFIERWAVHAGYDDIAVGQIVMACDEAASNVFRHGYERRPGPLLVQARVDPSSFFVEMTDEAGPIDPGKIKPRALDELRPGGLGTFIMNQVFDEVIYEPRAGGTALRLRKALPEVPRAA